MKITSLKIPEVKILEPVIFKDNRGFFFESYNHSYFNNNVTSNVNFLQDNHSKSSIGVIRGIHYQKAPFEQGKLVRVASGEIFDVAVDLRVHSPTFGKWVGEFISAQNKKQIWIPEGFGHGFLSLKENTEILYKVSNIYSPEHEISIKFNDIDININWPKIKNIDFLISEKDELNSVSLETFKSLI